MSNELECDNSIPCCQYVYSPSRTRRYSRDKGRARTRLATTGPQRRLQTSAIRLKVWLSRFVEQPPTRHPPMARSKRLNTNFSFAH